eukprot:TRINITY_DN2868_c0_g1_i2.p1 TRINITY_DN2868_c0_g1~~TRINITY_DN2868_c0_g1_i2.p1  ORF type:complete len:515 (-),score=87.52 TRINITY_DN2868_c0_g1_i2:82-1626(-)
MMQFHSDDYVNFLKVITPDNVNEYSKQLHRFNVGEDCPVFEGMWQFCQLSAGGSLAGAVRLNQGEADIAVNWAGGLHHAKKSEASGFCYINDIVLAILELLKHHQRVLYIDIDIHHGDGVEEAFYTTDRVMCVSFHKFGEYFPGTGDIRDIGANKGKYYSANFPLKDGIDDQSYENIFKPIIQAVIDWYRPEAIVMQCGADSLTGDRLGCFNLSLKGHASCLEFVKKFNLPLLVLGGGGYTIRNVARCWTYETSILLDTPISDELPYNDYLEYFGPDYRLHIAPSNMENQNSQEYLDKLRAKILDNLRNLPHAPSIPMREAAPDPSNQYADSDFEDEFDDPDSRYSQRMRDSKIAAEGELSDSDDDDDRRDEINYNDVSRSRLSTPASSSNKRPYTSPTATSTFTSPPPQFGNDFGSNSSTTTSVATPTATVPIPAAPINNATTTTSTSTPMTVSPSSSATKEVGPASQNHGSTESSTDSSNASSLSGVTSDTSSSSVSSVPAASSEPEPMQLS